MHVLNVFIPGDTTPAPQPTDEELVTVFHLPSSLDEHVNDTERVSQQIKSFLPFGRQLHKALYLLQAVAIMLLLLNIYLCRLKKSKNVGAGSRARRLARGEDGKEREDEAGSMAPELCGLLEAAVSSHQEDGGTQDLSLPPPAALTTIFPEDEKPRKRKRKAKWIEGGALGAAEQTKRAEPGKRKMGCCI